MKRLRFSVSSDRYHTIIKEISEGSEPESRFYLMVAVSTMIASFGLITNSTAVVIGAMLVAPLMTPIFGLALGLVRGDWVLFGKAVKAEVAGVTAAVIMGMLLGYVYPSDATPEMISRTQPHLFDLLVAVFSGFAGAYALIDEKISPALPGVAIATAIVPPLANTGLCFSAGSYAAGVGSFILFFANFLSILLVASIVFWLFGMSGWRAELTKTDVMKRFSLPVVCFIFVAIFLTNTLIKISRNHYINETLKTTLTEILVGYPDMGLDKMRYDEDDGKIYVSANIRSARVLTPSQVTRIQERLGEAINMPTELIVENTTAREISSLGADVRLQEQKLDGSFVAKTSNKLARNTKIADTILRNYLDDVAGLELDNLRVYTVAGNQLVVVASTYGILTPDAQAVASMEALLQEKLGMPNLRLLIRFIEAKLFDNSGSFRLEFSGMSAVSKEQQVLIDELIEFVENEITARGDIFIAGITYNLLDEKLNILVEASSLNNIDKKDVEAIEQKANRLNELPVNLFVYMKNEAVVTKEGNQAYSTLSRSFFMRQHPNFSKAIRDIVELSN